MTKEEIAAMIAAKIEGQGTNVDAGSALPAILNGILELIPEKASIIKVSGHPGTGVSKESAATLLEITEDEVDMLFKQNTFVKIETSVLTCIQRQNEETYGFALYGGYDVAGDTYVQFYIRYTSDDGYTFQYIES